MSLPYCCKYYKCYVPVVCTCVFAVLTILSSDQKCHTYFHFEFLLSVQTSIFLNPYREPCACSICVMPYTHMYTCMYTRMYTHMYTCMYTYIVIIQGATPSSRQAIAGTPMRTHAMLQPSSSPGPSKSSVACCLPSF